MNKAFFDFDQYDIPKLVEAEVSKNAEDKIAIVISKEDFREHQNLLVKILSAISFDLKKNVRLIQIDKHATLKIVGDITEGIEDVICFGINPRQISFNSAFRANVVYQTETFSIMLAHSLDKLSQDNTRKKALWAALQSRYLQK